MLRIGRSGLVINFFVAFSAISEREKETP